MAHKFSATVACVLLVALSACSPAPAPIATSAPTIAPTALAMSTLAPTATPTLVSTPLPTFTPTITPTPAPDTTAALALARTQIKNFNDKDFSVTATWLADKRALVVIQSKTANDAWVLLPGAKELAIILLSDANGAVAKVGWDEKLQMFTAERNGEKVYYAPWLPKFGIDQLWTKNPLAPPPEKVLNAKTDAEMMQAAVESLNPGPEFKVWYTSVSKRPPEMITFQKALRLANERHVGTDLKLPDFANLPLELANAPQVAIDLGGLSMKKVFAAYIGEIGALGPGSDQMARVQYDPITHRYRLLINTTVLKPEFTNSFADSKDDNAGAGFYKLF